MAVHARSLWLALFGLCVPGAVPVAQDCRGGIEVIGEGTPGAMGVPRLETVGVPLEGKAFWLEVTRGLPGARGVLVFSSVDGGALWPGNDAVLQPAAPRKSIRFVLDAQGASEPMLRLPLVPDLCGRQLLVQAIVFDRGARGGRAFTRALLVRFGGPARGPLFLGQRIPIGEGIASMATADLNGDGWLDVVTANEPSNDISVRLGTGDLDLGDERRYPAGGAPSALVIGDVDLDGAPDVVTTNALTGDVSVLLGLGLGDGTFLDERRSAAGNAPRGLAMADLNQDGWPDLAVLHPEAFSVLLGNGDGTFATGWNQVSPGICALAPGDLDGDGAPDLVVASGWVEIVDPDPLPCEFGSRAFYRSEFVAFRGVGDGTFSSWGGGLLGHGSYCLSSGGPAPLPRWIDLGDLDGDGNLDAVVSGGGYPNSLSDPLHVLLGLGNGGFQSDHCLFPSGTAMAVIEDVDDDAVPDLLTEHHLWRGVGDGTFLPPSPLPVAGASAPGCGHVDDDATLDLAIRTPGHDDVSLWRGLGDGTFDVPPRYSYPGGSGPVTVVDVDGDRVLDAVVAAADVRVRRGLGKGRFAEEPEVYPVGGASWPVSFGQLDREDLVSLVVPSQAPSQAGVFVLRGARSGALEAPFRVDFLGGACSAALVDLDGDGASEIVAATRYAPPENGGEHGVVVVPGSGPLDWQPGALRFSVGDAPSSVAAEDLNGDGALDLVAANWRSDDVSVRLAVGESTFSDGTFAPAVNHTVAREPRGVALADLDQDGRADLAVACARDSKVVVRSGLGDGAFGVSHEITVWNHPVAVALGDVDEDGVLDLVVPDEYSDDLAVLLGLGDGTFAAAIIVPAGDGPRSVAVGDLDQDGRMDLVTPGYLSGELLVLHGGGDGSFTPLQSLPVGGRPHGVALGDLDGDGHTDVAVANSTTHDVSVLYGNGDGTLSGAASLPVGRAPHAVAIRDLNGDARADLITANHGPVPCLEGCPGYSEDVTVRLGRNGGGFEEPQSFSSGTGSWALALADLNGDGRPDVAVANEISDDLSVLLGRQDGSLGAVRFVPTPGTSPIGAMKAGDLNADGRPDVVVVRGGALSVLLGTGALDLPTPVVYPAGANLSSLEIADLNGDRVLDLAALGDEVGILLGLGGGTFAPVHTYPVGPVEGAHFGRLALGDLDGDAITDVVVVSEAISLRRGLGDGTFGEQVHLGAPMRLNYVDQIAIGDLDQDGALDLFVVSHRNALETPEIVLLNHLMK